MKALKNRLKFSFSFSFFFLITFILLFDENNISFFSLISSFLHEGAHIITLLFFDSCRIKVSFKLAGISISAQKKPSLEWAFLLSGPLFNLILALGYPLFPVFSAVNLVIGLLNLYPVYFTDGGRLLFLLLKKLFPINIAEKAELIISGILLVPLITLGVLVAIKSPLNSSLLIIAVYVAFCLFSRGGLD